MCDPISKLIESISAAIGKNFEPYHTRKMADADAYRIKKISEEMRNNSDLPIRYAGNGIEIDSTNFEELRRRAGHRLAYQEVCKQENIEMVVDKAVMQLEGKESKSTAALDKDWMNRFFGMAGEISTEKMQEIWAGILAGEVLIPGSYSMKTLECLRNMSASDAILFENIAMYILEDDYLINNSDLNTNIGISYSDILALDDLGLINSSGTISKNREVVETPVSLCVFDDYILVATAKENTKISYQVFPLTRAGKELLNVVHRKELDIDKIKDIARCFKKENQKINISLHKITERNGDEISFDKREIDT